MHVNLFLLFSFLYKLRYLLPCHILIKLHVFRCLCIFGVVTRIKYGLLFHVIINYNMNNQILGEHYRFRQKRTDLNETTRSKQLETQIVNIQSNKQRERVALPHIVQAFQNSGLDSNDINYMVKRAKFPSKMANIFNGDYVEVYCGFSAYLTGVNVPQSAVWANDLRIITMVDDMSTYRGVRLYFDTKGADKLHLNAYEIVQMLNEQLKQQVQAFKQTYYDTYTYDGMPAQDFSQQIVYDSITYSLLSRCAFVYDFYTGKFAITIDTDSDMNVYMEHTAASNVVFDETGTPTYLFPSGSYSAGNVESTYDVQSFEVQIHPGRELLHHRQYRLGQILGSDMTNFSYSLGKLCGAHTRITECGSVIDAVTWDASARGTIPTSFTFFGTSPMDTTPVKQIFVYGGLHTNMWGQAGAKEGFFFVYDVNGTNLIDSVEHQIDTDFFSSKENIQGMRSGFEIVLQDEFGQDPCLMDNYYMEIAFKFHN